MFESSKELVGRSISQWWGFRLSCPDNGWEFELFLIFNQVYHYYSFLVGLLLDYQIVTILAWLGCFNTYLTAKGWQVGWLVGPCTVADSPWSVLGRCETCHCCAGCG